MPLASTLELPGPKKTGVLVDTSSNHANQVDYTLYDVTQLLRHGKRKNDGPAFVRVLFCHLCAQMFSFASLPVHLRVCFGRHQRAAASIPRSLRPELRASNPVPFPKGDSSWFEYELFNESAMNTYRQNLITCTCGVGLPLLTFARHCGTCPQVKFGVAKEREQVLARRRSHSASLVRNQQLTANRRDDLTGSECPSITNANPIAASGQTPDGQGRSHFWESPRAAHSDSSGDEDFWDRQQAAPAGSHRGSGRPCTEVGGSPELEWSEDSGSTSHEHAGRGARTAGAWGSAACAAVAGGQDPFARPSLNDEIEEANRVIERIRMRLQQSAAEGHLELSDSSASGSI